MVFVVAVLAQNWVLDRELPSRLTGEDLERGRALYTSYCERCHGADGDDSGYPLITPLSGLSLRLGDSRVRAFAGPSFYARGRFFPPAEARVLMAHILTLPGEKGYSRPDAIVSPQLLGQKLSDSRYMVIDVRSQTEFGEDHIPQAINLPPENVAERARPRLAPGLSDRILVLYDDGAGLQAARVWRAILDSGHRAVAVLDGGIRRWRLENRETSTRVPEGTSVTLLVDSPDLLPVSRTATIPGRSGGAGIPLNVDWNATVTGKGFREASELRKYFTAAGFTGPGLYRLEGAQEYADLFALQMYLLGFEARSTNDGEIEVTL